VLLCNALSGLFFWGDIFFQGTLPLAMEVRPFGPFGAFSSFIFSINFATIDYIPFGSGTPTPISVKLLNRILPYITYWTST
jgi:hypothetical protein